MSGGSQVAAGPPPACPGLPGRPRLQNTLAVPTPDAAVDAPLTDLTLELRDSAGGRIHASPDLAEEILAGAEPILCRFLAYLPEEPAQGQAQKPIPQRDVADAAARFRVRFAPQPDFFRFGHDPRPLLEELRELATSWSVETDLSALPLGDEDFDPEACHVAWSVTLETSAGANALRDVFMFVEDECDLEIEALAPPTATTASPAATSRIDEPAEPPPPLRPAATSAGETMRVAAEKLDRLVDMVGELVILRSQVTNACDTLEAVPDELGNAAEALQRLTVNLRDVVLDLRTMPIGDTFNKFHRLTRDLSRDLGKEVKLTIEGGDTAMDKTVLEQLRDPLVHLVRNSLDHGLETAAERVLAGKSPVASLHLAAEQRGDRVCLTVRDDGRGIDPEKIRAKAIARGILEPHASLSPAELQQLVFHPGFSTAEAVSELSGRGVGLDVVKRQLELLRGSIQLESVLGQGTTIHLSVPLTLAIIDGLLVRIGEDRYVIPLSAARETINLTAEQRRRYNGRPLVELRDEPLPYLHLRELFDYDSPTPELEKVVVVELENQRLGLVVDEVIGQYQTVLKTLGWLGQQVDAFSGATVLANGHIGLICDIPGLLRLSERKSGQRLEELVPEAVRA